MPGQAVLASANFGSAAQALQTSATLYSGTVRLQLTAATRQCSLPCARRPPHRAAPATSCPDRCASSSCRRRRRLVVCCTGCRRCSPSLCCGSCSAVSTSWRSPRASSRLARASRSCSLPMPGALPKSPSPRATPLSPGRCWCDSTPTCTKPTRARCAASSHCAACSFAGSTPSSRIRRLPASTATPTSGFARMDAQHRANRTAYADALAQERASVARIEQDLRAATAVLVKLQRTVPIYRTMADRFATLQAEGFVSELAALERQRDRIEKEQDEAAQQHTVESLEANLAQAQRRLRAGRVDVSPAASRRAHAGRKPAHAHRGGSRKGAVSRHGGRAASAAGRSGQGSRHAHDRHRRVPGQCPSDPGPRGRGVAGRRLIRNLDVGFVHVGQSAKVKVATYPFQKYGSGGWRRHARQPRRERSPRAATTVRKTLSRKRQNGYRARVALAAQSVAFDGKSLPLASGMQVECGDPTRRAFVARIRAGAVPEGLARSSPRAMTMRDERSAASLAMSPADFLWAVGSVCNLRRACSTPRSSSASSRRRTTIASVADALRSLELDRVAFRWSPCKALQRAALPRLIFLRGR